MISPELPPDPECVFWHSIAAASGRAQPVLQFGVDGGAVAFHLAKNGIPVLGIEPDPSIRRLLEHLGARTIGKSIPPPWDLFRLRRYVRRWRRGLPYRALHLIGISPQQLDCRMLRRKHPLAHVRSAYHLIIAPGSACMEAGRTEAIFQAAARHAAPHARLFIRTNNPLRRQRPLLTSDDRDWFPASRWASPVGLVVCATELQDGELRTRIEPQSQFEVVFRSVRAAWVTEGDIVGVAELARWTPVRRYGSYDISAPLTEDSPFCIWEFRRRSTRSTGPI